jgi:hypothetical protein
MRGCQKFANPDEYRDVAPYIARIPARGHDDLIRFARYVGEAEVRQVVAIVQRGMEAECEPPIPGSPWPTASEEAPARTCRATEAASTRCRRAQLVCALAIIAPGDQPKTVMLDFVQPTGAARRLLRRGTANTARLRRCCDAPLATIHGGLGSQQSMAGWIGTYGRQSSIRTGS